MGARLTADGSMIGPIVTVVFVKLNTAGLGTPETSAETVKAPSVPFAVNKGDVATPAAFVVAVTVDWPPAKMPLGPATGARNVTVAPATGLAPASATVAENGDANCVLINAL